jgi:hypothetical protein
LSSVARRFYYDLDVTDPPRSLENACPEARAWATNPSVVSAIVNLLRRFDVNTNEPEVVDILPHAPIYAFQYEGKLLGFTTTMGVFINESFISMFENTEV